MSGLMVYSGGINKLCNVGVIGISSMVGFGLLYTLIEDDSKSPNNKRIKDLKSILSFNNINNPLGMLGLIGGVYCGYYNSPIRFLR